jgi:hypothetical protein
MSSGGGCAVFPPSPPPPPLPGGTPPSSLTSDHTRESLRLLRLHRQRGRVHHDAAVYDLNLHSRGGWVGWVGAARRVCVCGAGGRGP